MPLTINSASASQSGNTITLSANYTTDIGVCNVYLWRSTSPSIGSNGSGFEYVSIGTTTVNGSTSPGTYNLSFVDNGSTANSYGIISITSGSPGSVTTSLYFGTSAELSPATSTTYYYYLQFKGTSGSQQAFSNQFSISVVPAPGAPTGSTPDGTVGTAYSANITSTDATSYQISTGSLPTGLSLNSSTGRISGTPSVVGTFNFSITGRNAYGTSTSTAFSININALSLSLGSFSPTSGKVATAFTGTVNATNSTSVTISFTSGTGGGATGFAGLGLTASTTTTSATLSGTPTTPGTVTFSVTATNPTASPTSATNSFIVTIVGGGKRWNGTSWATLGTAKRWNGTSWVDITIRKRWNGTSWVDISN